MAQSPSFRQDVYHIITSLIIEKLERGVIPWKKSWSAQGPAANYVTKKPYRGINALLLNSIGLSQPYFLTFRQAQRLGGHIQKGAKSLPVVYWQWYFRHSETGRKLTEEEAKALSGKEVARKAFLRYYRVFPIQDTEGIDFELSENKPIKLPEDQLMRGFEPLHAMPHRVAVKTIRQRPYYHPRHDYINMPAMNAFSSAETYFQVLYHELTHATGHPKRLNRSGVSDPQPFGSWSYSQDYPNRKIIPNF